MIPLTPRQWFPRAIRLLSFALLASAAMGQSGFTFTLGGKPIPLGMDGLWVRGGLVSLNGTPDAPARDDLLWIPAKTHCLVRLGEPGSYEFSDELQGHGRVRLRRGDREQVAVLDSKRLVAADDATRRQLLGVVVEHWNDDVAAAIAALDPLVPLVVTDHAAIGERRALPALPSGIHHLALSYETKEGFGDLAAAVSLTNLRTLYLGGHYCGFTNVDLRPFANAGRLRAFVCDQSDLTGAEVLEGFRELRSFAAQGFPLTTFALLQRATELRRLYCWGPRAGDIEARSLTPLAGLPRLEHVELLFTPVSELPATGFATLRTLYLHGCDLPAAQQRAFRKAHPECKIDGEVDDEQLQSLLATADRLVVRTGGTCHRREKNEKVLFDSASRDEIAKVLPLLHVVENRDSFYCGCCGGPTLVFYAAGAEIASLGVHHGQSIRWAGGPWNSDAALTRAAGEGLAQWIADHGAHRPLTELRQLRARAAAGPRRARLRAAVFGATLADDADLDALGTKWLEQASASATTDGGLTQVRLLGSHEGAWNAPDEFDQALVAAAAESAKNTAAWSTMLDRCGADERAALGLAAVWVATEGEQLPSERRTQALPIVAPAALRSPQPWNRARMLQRLRDDTSNVSLELLVAALAGKFAPRQVREEELIAPGGMRVIHPGDPVLDRSGAGTQALAALCLASRKHTASLPSMRALLENATKVDAKVLADAIAQLEAVK